MKPYFLFYRVHPVLVFLVIVALAAGAAGRTRAIADWEATVGTLSGKVVVVDPGHGGRDSGAVGRAGVLEKNVTLPIGLYLRDLLEKAGVRVIMTRTTDTDLSGLEDVDVPQRQRWRQGLINRVEIVNNSGADVLVTIHANAVGASRWRGAQTFWSADSQGDSKRLAHLIQEELTEITGRTDRKPSSKIHQYILEESKIPAVNVEVGFLSNGEEERLLADRDYQRRLAWSIFVGLARYFTTGPVPK